MCLLCDNKNISGIRRLIICDKVQSIPDTLINLEELYCNNNKNIILIPNTFGKLKTLDANNTNITIIPPELLKLQTLWLANTNIIKLPNELQKLQILYIGNTQITTIPITYKNLKILWRNSQVIVDRSILTNLKIDNIIN